LVAAWLVLNAVTGIAGVGSEGVPVAWVAHVGGFLAGLLLYPLLVRQDFVGK
jgi:membrane associated rhomboid family serine protease